jgi:hypothetical protein
MEVIDKTSEVLGEGVAALVPSLPREGHMAAHDAARVPEQAAGSLVCGVTTDSDREG